MSSVGKEQPRRTVAAERGGVRRPRWQAFLAGATVGLLGGLVGLGGAEFRLPLLIGLFGFVALQAVIINKAMSLVVVLAAVPSRLFAVPFEAVVAHWLVAVSLLAGSLPGAWIGASWATRMRTATLHRVLGVLLLAIAAVFAASTSAFSHSRCCRPPRRLPLVSSPGSASAWWLRSWASPAVNCSSRRSRCSSWWT